ncbi:MAG: hypothetical protein IRZ00_03920 [Gemmatimonadetes bacterium]|nr:hypothetical protein [Gemmatimonadota bacterium]
MRAHRWVLLATAIAAVAVPVAARLGPDLRGSHDSMVRQNQAAQENNYAFARDEQQIHELIGRNELVEVRPSQELAFKGVSYAYARPVVREFVERLAHDYHEACDTPLVVTSLVRPLSRQPRNASPLSVHPAGMAVDMHIPPLPACRIWLEKRLLALEARGVIDVTRERRPPHFHVAVYPTPYRTYLAALDAATNGTPAAGAAGPRSAGAERGARARGLLGVTGALAATAMAVAGALVLRIPLRRRRRR